MTTATRDTTLTDALLHTFQERAPAYDRENRFFQQDFDDLKAAGFLNLSVPRELGGQGASVLQVSRELRRLAYHAPATALAVNMHLYWTGIAGNLWHNGDKSLEWILRDSI